MLHNVIPDTFDRCRYNLCLPTDSAQTTAQSGRTMSPDNCLMSLYTVLSIWQNRKQKLFSLGHTIRIPYFHLVNEM
jgi:hypothetical protein